MKNLLEQLMDHSPAAMLPLGYNLAQGGRLDELMDWVRTASRDNWTGIIALSPGAVKPTAITVSRSPTSPNQDPISCIASPATIIADALAQGCLTNPLFRAGDLPLKEKESRLLELYLDAIAQHPAHLKLRDELLWALCGRVNRSEPVKRLIQAGADIELSSLKQDPQAYQVSHAQTALFVSLCSENGAMPWAFMGLCEGLEGSILQPEKSPPDCLSGFDLEYLAHGLRADRDAHSSLWSSLLTEPRLGEMNDRVGIVFRLLRQIELRCPRTEDHGMGRQWLARHYLQACAQQGLAWDGEALDYLLGRSARFKNFKGLALQTPEECARIDASGKEDIFDTLPDLVAAALAAHCPPVLLARRDFFTNESLRLDFLKPRFRTALINGNANAKDFNLWFATPLMHVVAGLAPEQPDNAELQAQTLAILADFNQLEPEKTAGRRNVFHYLAEANPPRKFEWLKRLLELGLDDGLKNERGRTPIKLINPGDGEQWQHVVRAHRARAQALDALNAPHPTSHMTA